jgi:hypothetical protein
MAKVGPAFPNISTASENVVAITNDLRTGSGETSKVIETADQIAVTLDYRFVVSL